MPVDLECVVFNPPAVEWVLYAVVVEKMLKPLLVGCRYPHVVCDGMYAML